MIELGKRDKLPAPNFPRSRGRAMDSPAFEHPDDLRVGLRSHGNSATETPSQGGRVKPWRVDPQLDRMNRGVLLDDIGDLIEWQQVALVQKILLLIVAAQGHYREK